METALEAALIVERDLLSNDNMSERSRASVCTQRRTEELHHISQRRMQILESCTRHAADVKIDYNGADEDEEGAMIELSYKKRRFTLTVGIAEGDSTFSEAFSS